MSAAPVENIESKALRRGLPSNVEAEQFVLGSFFHYLRFGPKTHGGDSHGDD